MRGAILLHILRYSFYISSSFTTNTITNYVSTFNIPTITNYVSTLNNPVSINFVKDTTTGYRSIIISDITMDNY